MPHTSYAGHASAIWTRSPWTHSKTQHAAFLDFLDALYVRPHMRSHTLAMLCAQCSRPTQGMYDNREGIDSLT